MTTSILKEQNMKTKKHFIAMALIAIITVAIIGCKQDVPADTPKVQPDASRTLSFGTPACTVTITSNDLFTTAEWNTLCDKAVAAIERGYTASGLGAKTNIETYFTSNNVSVVLSKSAIYDVETKSDVPKTIYFKANASVIDGITDANLSTVLAALRSSASYPTS
jgi:hypothetical protein